MKTKEEKGVQSPTVGRKKFSRPKKNYFADREPALDEYLKKNYGERLGDGFRLLEEGVIDRAIEYDF